MPAVLAVIAMVLGTIAAAPAARAATGPASGNTGISGSGASTGTQDEKATQLNGGPPCATVTLPDEHSILNLQDTGGYTAVSGSTSSVYNGNSTATITATQSFSISPAGTFANSTCSGAPGPIAVKATMTAPNGAVDCTATGTLLRANTSVVINVSGPCTVTGNTGSYTSKISDPSVTHVFNGHLLPCGIAPCSPPIQDFSGTYHASAVLPGAPASLGDGVPTGIAYGFGGNDNGQLGDGTAVERSTPAPVSGLGPVRALATSGGYDGRKQNPDADGHSLAVKSDGTVWSWGSNRDGELGTGVQTQAPKMTPQQVQLPVAAGNPFIAVAAGGWDDVNAYVFGEDSLALRADGTVWAWGDNSCGRLGDGRSNTRATPKQVVDPADPSKPFAHVIAIAAGNGHNLALRDDGSVWGWGDDTHGELGDGNGGAVVAGPPIATDPTTDPQGQALKIARWGFFGPYFPACNLTSTPVQAKLGAKKAVAISAVAHKSYAILEDHTLVHWGLVIGVGAITGGSLPLPVEVPGLAGRTIRSVAPSDKHDLALADDGTIWAWGDNASGELGNAQQPVGLHVPIYGVLVP